MGEIPSEEGLASVTLGKRDSAGLQPANKCVPSHFCWALRKGFAEGIILALGKDLNPLKQ